MGNITDSIPLVSQVKSAVQAIVGDKDAGANAMKAASIIAGVIGGFLVGGPFGSLAGGIAGAAGINGIITGVKLFLEILILSLFGSAAGRAYAKLVRSITARLTPTGNLKTAVTQAAANGNISPAQEANIIYLAEQLESVAKEIHTHVKRANVEGPVVGREVIDFKGDAHLDYAFKLRKAVGADGFGGDVATVQEILSDRSAGRAPRPREAAAGKPQYAGIHALHREHIAPGLDFTLCKTISVMYDPKSNATFPMRLCGNCERVETYGDMGKMPGDADSARGTLLINEDVVFTACLDLLAPCHCEGDEDDNKTK